MRKLTDKQKQLCKMLAANRKLHKTERLAEGEIYNKAGYNNKHPAQAVAVEIRKPHVKARLLQLDPAFFGTVQRAEAEMDEAEWAYEQLKKFAPNNAQAANNLVEYHRKKDADGGGVDVVPVLLSPFLSESQLDEYKSKTPQDVVVATENKLPEVSVDAKSTENIEDSDDCE